MKNVKNIAHLSRTCCKHSRPLPYYMQKKQDAPVLEATQHHRPASQAKVTGIFKTLKAIFQCSRKANERILYLFLFYNGTIRNALPGT